MDPIRNGEVQLYKAYTIDEVLERRELLTSSSGTETRTEYLSSTQAFLHYFSPGSPL